MSASDWPASDFGGMAVAKSNAPAMFGLHYTTGLLELLERQSVDLRVWVIDPTNEDHCQNSVECKLGHLPTQAASYMCAIICNDTGKGLFLFSTPCQHLQCVPHLWNSSTLILIQR